MVTRSLKKKVLEHIENTLGKISAVASGQDEEGNDLPFDLALIPDCPAEGATTIVTVGLSDTEVAQSSGGKIRQEFVFCAYQRYGTEWFSEFMKVMGYVCDAILKDGQAVASGDVFDLGSPIAPGSRVSALYFSDPLYHIEDFWKLETAKGEVFFGWMLPITGDEMAFLSEKGPDELDRAFTEQEPDLMDLGRESVTFLKH